MNHSKNHFYFEMMRKNCQIASNEWFIPKGWKPVDLDVLMAEKDEAVEEAAELFASLGDNAGEIIPDEEIEFEEELIESGKLIVATSTDYAPYEFIDLTKEGQDKFVGADITLAKYIANKLGLELEIKSMNFDVVLTALDSDKADLAISGFTYSDSRAASYLFSESYFLEGEGDQIIVTTKAVVRTP